MVIGSFDGRRSHTALTMQPPIRISTTRHGTPFQCRRIGCCPARPPRLREGSYGRPIYTNVQYPFPIDPPHVPDENPTADHRRTELPDWSAERILLRFDGVESVYRVWLNGIEIGVGKGSRLVQEFDITEVVRPGRNDLGSGAPVVVDELSGGSRSMVAARHLSRRHGAEPPVRAVDDVWLRTEYAADGTGSIHDPEIIASERRTRS